MRLPAVLSLFALLSLPACGSEDGSAGTAAGAAPKHAPSVTATRVEVATVRASQPVVRIVRPGEVQGAREAHLASALGGFVEAVKVDSGQRVAKGAPIAYIDTGIHNAQAKLTKVEVDDAKRELARIERLGKAVAGARLDAARTRLERARAQHALSQTRQARAVIRAPFAGVIVELGIERGEVAAPGAPIGRLIQLDPAHVSVSVNDRDVTALKVGGVARVTTAGITEPIDGTIHKIEPAADMQTRTFLVEVAVANADQRLLPGMIARVQFEKASAENAVLLPQDFLVTKLDGNGVFVVDKESVARWRPVTLGAILGSQVEVVSGLADGERIVILGHRDLADGDRLIITRAGVCCERGRVTYPKTAMNPSAGAGDVAADTDAKAGEATP